MRPNLDDGWLVYAHAFLTQRVHNDVDRQRVLLLAGRSCHARGVRETQDTRLWKGKGGEENQRRQLLRRQPWTKTDGSLFA